MNWVLNYAWRGLVNGIACIILYFCPYNFSMNLVERLAGGMAISATLWILSWHEIPLYVGIFTININLTCILMFLVIHYWSIKCWVHKLELFKALLDAVRDHVHRFNVRRITTRNIVFNLQFLVSDFMSRNLNMLTLLFCWYVCLTRTSTVGYVAIGHLQVACWFKI